MTAIDLSPARAAASLARLTCLAELDDDAAVERYAGIVWSILVEPGDGVAGRLIAERGSVESLRQLMHGRLPASAAFAPRELEEGRKRWMPRLVPNTVAHAIDVAAVTGIRHIAPRDPQWPPQFADLGENAPLALWVRGQPAVLARLQPSIAIVGARAASSYGEHVATEFAAELAGGGIPVVSGAAYGIDGAAHRGALGAGGLTVALLAGGVDRPYPAGHTDLIDRIAVAGAVVSEVPCGSTPTKWRFLARNRLIAALADATVVVEAGWRSGSLNTAGHAATLGRGLGAVPGPITSGTSVGCHRLLREFGAQCITSAAEARELVGFDTAPPLSLPEDDRPRTDDRMRVRDALSSRVARSADDIARRSGMSPDAVQAVLGVLLLEQEVAREPNGWRRRPAGR